MTATQTRYTDNHGFVVEEHTIPPGLRCITCQRRFLSTSRTIQLTPTSFGETTDQGLVTAKITCPRCLAHAVQAVDSGILPSTDTD